MSKEKHHRFQLLVLDGVMKVSEAVTNLLNTLAECLTKYELHPVRTGKTALAMFTAIHFATFVAASAVTVECNKERAQTFC